MFEQPDSRENNKTGRIVAVIGVAALALAAGLFAVLGDFSTPPPEAPKQQQGLPDAKRAGDPVFDQYKPNILLANKKFFTQGNLLGQVQAVMKGEIINAGDKTVRGIELRATVLFKDGKSKSIVASPVPKMFEKIPPQAKVTYDVVVDGVPKPEQIDDMKIEIEGIVIE